jgi:hypothetical protein
MANQLSAIDSAPSQFKANLWQLSRLARASLTTDNHYLVGLQSFLYDLTLT